MTMMSSASCPVSSKIGAGIISFPPIAPSPSIDHQSCFAIVSSPTSKSNATHLAQAVYSSSPAVNPLFLFSGSDMHACMTDSSNQHPPPIQPPLHSELPLTCTPGVCQIADVTMISPLSRPESAYHVAGTVLAPPIHPLHQIGQQQPAAHLASHPGHRPNVAATLPPAGDHHVIAEPSIPSSINSVHVHQTDSMVVHSPSSSAPYTRSMDSLPSDPGPPSSSHSLKLSAALDRLKNKVHFHPKFSSEYTSNQFDALQSDSDDDGHSESETPHDSDMDDGLVHPHCSGYHSADGRSSTSNRKPLALSGHKINKRHPNVPLNAKLRSRKSSCPSSP